MIRDGAGEVGRAEGTSPAGHFKGLDSNHSDQGPRTPVYLCVERVT